MSAQLAGSLNRGALAETLDNFQRYVPEQVGEQSETAQALEFGNLVDDAVEADRAGVSFQLVENRSTGTVATFERWLANGFGKCRQLLVSALP